MSAAETSDALAGLSQEGESVRRRASKRVSVSKQTSLIHKGQNIAGAYIVARGRLRVFTYTPQGKEATLYFIGQGETCIFALNCLFNDLRYPAWVEAVEDSLVEVIPGTVYRELFTREEVVRNLTVKALSTLVFRLMGELEQVHTCKLDQRLANFLLSNASDQGTVHMTQQQLASHLGTTREVVARLIQGFTAQDLVRTGRGTVTITDAKRLSDLSIPVP